jgi:RimJ/RimL family protein N-acetyltransferase
MTIQFEIYDEVFLAKSWTWLNNKRIRELTMTPEFSMEDQKKWYNSIKIKNDYMIWGIKCDNVPIGVCGLKNIKKKEGEYWGYIGEQSYWGNGIGSQMMRMIIDKSKELHLIRVYLKVLDTNLRAIKLYEKFNFSITSIQTNIVTMTLNL